MKRRTTLSLDSVHVFLLAALLAAVFYMTHMTIIVHTPFDKKDAAVVVLTITGVAKTSLTKSSEIETSSSLHVPITVTSSARQSTKNDAGDLSPISLSNQTKVDRTSATEETQTTFDATANINSTSEFNYATNSTAVEDSPSRLSPPPTTSSPSLFFITAKFGRNNRFAQHVSNFAHFVNASGIVAPDHIFPYSEFPDFILSDPRFAQHTEFLRDKRHSSARGGGYWFWKAVLLQHHLKQAQDGDFVVHFDTDQAHFVPTLPSILRVLQERSANLAIRQLPYLQKHWTKPGVHDVFCPGMTRHDIEADSFFQVEASRIVVRKSQSTVQLIDAWVDMVANYHLISDEVVILPSAVSNATSSTNTTNATTPFTVPGFRQHRHDQSLFSALLQCGPLNRRTTAYGPTKMDVCAELKRENVTLDERHVKDVCRFGPFVTFVVE